MTSKMLIDTVHPEETRVTVLRGDRVEDFDFESASRKQLRGNIYLAKVTRVEPSLQAAFVDYGGNRHGFLAFSEIHPDYYQIPVADRQELLRQEEEDEKSALEADEAEEHLSDADSGDDLDSDGEANDPEPAETVDVAADDQETSDEDTDESDGDTSNGGQRAKPETVATNDAYGEVPERRQRRPRPYKIQEVIKRRQILLVQVVKEERGNKGAALTTYLSLAGRYSVLMPNTARGGGISRKIANASDRKRLKSIVSDLDVPHGMGVILRTAGANRTKAEVRRDFDYLLRLWENVRTLTLESHAPRLVYEEGSLVKRAIRDLYSKDIDEVLVSGEDGYREAKDLMRMLMPSHAKNVKSYKDTTPLFVRYGIEAQLDGLFQPQVTLKSGGYLVINQTEALVAIDVNSGRSTKEHSIEETALKTNLEAAVEVARQLRLRDLAGLVVVDFIDMNENRNNRAVERKIKDALKIDRARIQVGRISSFGLLEMSRQRLRSSVLEGSTDSCPHCGGTGHVRSVESVTLHVLRAIETAIKDAKTSELTAHCAPEAAFYILNHKRDYLRHFEEDYGVTVSIVGDALALGVDCRIESGGEPIRKRPSQPNAPVTMDVDDEDVAETSADVEADGASEDATDGDRPRKRRRRRRGRGDRSEERTEASSQSSEDAKATDDDTEGSADTAEASDAKDGDEEEGKGRRSRRRGRRGGRRNRRSASAEGQDANENGADGAEPASTDDDPQVVGPAETQAADSVSEEQTDDQTEEDKPKKAPRRRTRRSRKSDAETDASETAIDAAPAEAETVDSDPIEIAAQPDAAAEIAPVNGKEPSPEALLENGVEEADVEVVQDAAPEPEDKPTGPKRTGWWQRAFSPKD